MLRTEAQRNASRVNGARSHGPVTPEGKANSSRNGVTHGLFSETILLRSESRDAWNRLSADLAARFQPADNVEWNLVYEMAATTWRAQRAAAMERAIVDLEMDALDLSDAPSLSPEDETRKAAMAYCKAAGRDKAIFELGRQSIRLNNLWMRLHRKLKELQADRLAAATPPPPSPAPEAKPAPPEQSQSEPGPAEPASNQSAGPAAGSHPRPAPAPPSLEPRPCTGS